jgi:hypothetical protein
VGPSTVERRVRRSAAGSVVFVGFVRVIAGPNPGSSHYLVLDREKDVVALKLKAIDKFNGGDTNSFGAVGKNFFGDIGRLKSRFRF